MTEMNHTDLFEKTIAVSISFGTIANQRRTSLTGVEVDADKDRLNMNALILQCPEMKAIRGVMAKTRERILDDKKGLTLPALFKRGVALVPIALIGDVENILSDARVELAAHVEALILNYEQRIEEDRARLRSRFNTKHYPSKAALRDTFTISWRYLQLTPSSQLKAISSEVYQKEVARVMAEAAQLGDTIKQTMRAAAHELVKALHDRLGYDKEGNPLVFRNSTVNNLTAFLDTLAYRNVTGDQELSDLMAEMSALLNGVDADALRNNEGLRKAVESKTAEIIGGLDSLVMEQHRRVVLPDEDEETVTV
jgi:hypothetical protein